MAVFSAVVHSFISSSRSSRVHHDLNPSHFSSGFIGRRNKTPTRRLFVASSSHSNLKLIKSNRRSPYDSDDDHDDEYGDDGGGWDDDGDDDELFSEVVFLFPLFSGVIYLDSFRALLVNLLNTGKKKIP